MGKPPVGSPRGTQVPRVALLGQWWPLRTSGPRKHGRKPRSAASAPRPGPPGEDDDGCDEDRRVSVGGTEGDRGPGNVAGKQPLCVPWLHVRPGTTVHPGAVSRRCGLYLQGQPRGRGPCSGRGRSPGWHPSAWAGSGPPCAVASVTGLEFPACKALSDPEEVRVQGVRTESWGKKRFSRSPSWNIRPGRPSFPGTTSRPRRSPLELCSVL